MFTPVDIEAGLALPVGGLKGPVAAAVKDAMRQMLIDAVSDQLGHAEALAVGPVNFRIAVVKEYGPMWGNSREGADMFANIAFECLRRAWADKYEYSPEQFLDKVHVPKPLSDKEWQEEVDNAWEIEIGSDERSMRENYEGSARVRKGKFLGLRRGKDYLMEDGTDKK